MPDVAALLHGFAHSIALAVHVEPPFRRQLLATFGNECHLVGPHFEGDRDHLRIDGQFEVEPDLHGLPEEAKVAVLDMPAVLPEMHGDPVGAAELSQDGRPRPGPVRHRPGPASMWLYDRC